MLPIQPTNHHPLTATQEPYEKAYHLTKIIEELSGEKVRRKGQYIEKKGKKKRQDRKSNGRRQENKRRDSKVESNDCPEIPATGEPSSPASREGKGIGGGGSNSGCDLYLVINKSNSRRQRSE